ncbi:MAG: PAS domain-containing protein [Limisphaerales bacterium]
MVFGPTHDAEFAAEIVRAGAQDYLAKDKLDPDVLQRTLRCALERQHERTALIEEKDNYYGVFDHLVEGIFRTTPDGHYLLANIALARIYGYESPVELMASITDIAHRLYVEPGRREEFVQLMQANDTITGFESRIYLKDETIIWISENCRAVRDPQGNLLYYEGTVEDISERKHAEEEIRRTTAELSAAAKNCARKTSSWRKTSAWREKSRPPCCRSNIRSFRPMSRPNKACFNSPIATSPPNRSAAIFSASPPFPKLKSGFSFATWPATVCVPRSSPR